MDSTEHALNCFLSSKSAASTEIARDCGVSYVSWIKAKYGNKVEVCNIQLTNAACSTCRFHYILCIQEVLRDEEDFSQWQKDFDESNNTKLAQDSVEAQGATERQTEEDEMKDIDLTPEKGSAHKEALFFHSSVKVMSLRNSSGHGELTFMLHAMTDR